jgi:hypothetical protein
MKTRCDFCDYEPNPEYTAARIQWKYQGKLYECSGDIIDITDKYIVLRQNEYHIIKFSHKKVSGLKILN